MRLIYLMLIVSASIAHVKNEEHDVAFKSVDEAVKGFLPSPALHDSVREGKTLVNTFPFNQQRHGDHGQGQHAHVVDRQESVPARESRQRSRNRNRNRNRQTVVHAPDPDEGHGAPSFSEVAAAGERCIDKIEFVEHTEYDDQVTCKHSYSEQCHQSYVTDYKPAQKEECEEQFVKNCHIQYTDTAVQENVNVCVTHTPCDGEGPTEPRNVPFTRCETTYELHEVDDDIVNCKTVYEESCEPEVQGYQTVDNCKKWPKIECDKKTVPTEKWTPKTECRTEKRKVDFPGGCILGTPVEHCHDEQRTVVNPKPLETCTLDPQQNCRHVTVLVPFLKPVDECVDVPKEVCSRSRTNPKKVKKAVVKKWCYTPS